MIRSKLFVLGMENREFDIENLSKDKNLCIVKDFKELIEENQKIIKEDLFLLTIDYLNHSTTYQEICSKAHDFSDEDLTKYYNFLITEIIYEKLDWQSKTNNITLYQFLKYLKKYKFMQKFTHEILIYSGLINIDFKKDDFVFKPDIAGIDNENFNIDKYSHENIYRWIAKNKLDLKKFISKK